MPNVVVRIFLGLLRFLVMRWHWFWFWVFQRRTLGCETDGGTEAGLDWGAGARAYAKRAFAFARARSSSKPLRFAFMPRYPTRISGE